jgi:prefoldin subunit 5
MDACCGAGRTSKRIAKAHERAVREHYEQTEASWHERFSDLRHGHERQIKSMQDELALLTEQQRQLKTAKEHSHARMAALSRQRRHHGHTATERPAEWEHTAAGAVLEEQSATKLAEVKERYEAQLEAIRQELATMQATMQQLKEDKDKAQSEKEYLEILHSSNEEVLKPQWHSRTSTHKTILLPLHRTL